MDENKRRIKTSLGTIGRLNIILNAVDQTSGTLGKVSGSVKNLDSKLGGLKDSLKVAGGMLIRDFANKATRSIGTSLKLGGEIGTLQKAFDRLKESTGAETLSLEKLREATRGTISDVDLLTSANQWMMFGLPSDEFDELSEAAIRLGSAMGIDAQYAVDSLTVGLGRQSIKFLDNLGVVFDAQTAYEEFADDVGIAASALTEEQKTDAWIAKALEMIKEKAEDLGDTMSSQQLVQQQFTTWVTNLQTEAGELIGDLGLGGVGPIIESWGPTLTMLATTMLPNLAGAFTKVKTAVAGLNLSLTTLTSGLAALGLPTLAALGVHELAERYTYPEMERRGYKPGFWPGVWEQTPSAYTAPETGLPSGYVPPNVYVDVHDNTGYDAEELAEEIGSSSIDWMLSHGVVP